MKHPSEWRTLLILAGCYTLWLWVTANADWLGSGIAIPICIILLTLHSSLQHELLHGHPFHNPRWNEVLGFFTLGFVFPYRRFHALHLQHHETNLTDPATDPESNYRDPAAYTRLSAPMRSLLQFNNTLMGRLLIGPALAYTQFWLAETKLILQGNSAVVRAWLLHAIGCAAIVFWLLVYGEMSFPEYFFSAYFAVSVLLIRTFLEHRAVADPLARSVIVEDRGPLSWLFLNNNLHAVHHNLPAMAWYRLPAEYQQNRQQYLSANQGYRYRSYGEVFKRYFFCAKEPVAHPRPNH